jgi:hypothetical protein
MRTLDADLDALEAAIDAGNAAAVQELVYGLPVAQARELARQLHERNVHRRHEPDPALGFNSLNRAKLV